MKKSEEAEQKEEHLKIIVDSLKKAAIKFGKKEILIPKDYLSIRISDFIQVSTAQANNYLKILDGRNIIQFDNENVLYKLPEIPEKQEIIDIDDYFKNS